MNPHLFKWGPVSRLRLWGFIWGGGFHPLMLRIQLGISSWLPGMWLYLWDICYSSYDILLISCKFSCLSKLNWPIQFAISLWSFSLSICNVFIIIFDSSFSFLNRYTSPLKFVIYELDVDLGLNQMYCSCWIWYNRRSFSYLNPFSCINVCTNSRSMLSLSRDNASFWLRSDNTPESFSTITNFSLSISSFIMLLCVTSLVI